MIDLIRMRSYCYKAGGDGKGKESDIPTPFAEAAEQAHEELVELIAEGNDELLEEFFATGTLPCEHIVSGLRQAVKGAPHIPHSLRFWVAECRHGSAFELHLRGSAATFK